MKESCALGSERFDTGARNIYRIKFGKIADKVWRLEKPFANFRIPKHCSATAANE